MVTCGPAPTGVGQRTSKTVERITAVSRRVNGVATRAAASALRTQRVCHLVALVAEIKDVTVAMGGDPGAIVDKLRGGDQRTRSFERHVG